MNKLVKGDYKGSPMVVCQADDADRYPFSFGAGKAAKVLDSIAQHGIIDFVTLLKEVAGSKVSQETLDKVNQLCQ